MPKSLCRIIALLLIPAVIANPSLAAASCFAIKAAPTMGQGIYLQQAVVEPATEFRQSGLTSAPIREAQREIATRRDVLILGGLVGLEYVARPLRTFAALLKSEVQELALPTASSTDQKILKDLLDAHGGVDGLIAKYPGLNAAVPRHPQIPAEQLAKAFLLYLFFQNGGFSEFEISNHGEDIEKYVKTELVEAANEAGVSFWGAIRHTDHANALVLKLKTKFHPDLQHLDPLLSHLMDPSAKIKTTPVGAYLLYGVLLRYFGISDDVKLVMQKKEKILLLELRWGSEPLFVRIDERSSGFDFEAGETSKPGMDAFENYDFAKGWLFSIPGVRAITKYIGRIWPAKGLDVIEDYLANLEFFMPVAQLLGPWLMEQHLKSKRHSLERENLSVLLPGAPGPDTPDNLEVKPPVTQILTVISQDLQPAYAPDMDAAVSLSYFQDASEKIVAALLELQPYEKLPPNYLVWAWKVLMKANHWAANIVGVYGQLTDLSELPAKLRSGPPKDTPKKPGPHTPTTLIRDKNRPGVKPPDETPSIELKAKAKAAGAGIPEDSARATQKTDLPSTRAAPHKFSRGIKNAA